MLAFKKSLDRSYATNVMTSFTTRLDGFFHDIDTRAALKGRDVQSFHLLTQVRHVLVTIEMIEMTRELCMFDVLHFFYMSRLALEQSQTRGTLEILLDTEYPYEHVGWW